MTFIKPRLTSRPDWTRLDWAIVISIAMTLAATMIALPGKSVAATTATTTAFVPGLA
ncbi:MAG: hypothetical protein KGN34_18790 [Sphingomonadales bacterium]|nr:hypothetical protein [Sphingomonadales bacterium]